MLNERKGSSKIIRAVEPGVVDFIYTKGWSIYDRGTSPQTIPGIDRARCACAVKSFELAREAGLPTHFIEQINPTTIRVMEFSVPGKPPLSGKVHGRVIPLEWLYRMYAKGSLLERLKEGKITALDLGFLAGTIVTDGMKLPYLRLECTTKFEPVDRHLSDEEARELAELTDEQWAAARYLLERLAEVTDAQFRIANFLRPDGKGELAIRYADGAIVGVDVFGTQDENRIIDRTTGEVYDKDLIRDHFKTSPWKKALDEAKKKYPDDKSKWPEYPLLPGELVDLVSERYAAAAFRYAGVRIEA